AALTAALPYQAQRFGRDVEAAPATALRGKDPGGGEGGQVAGGGLIADLGAVAVIGAAYAVAEDSVEHGIHRPLGQVVRGAERSQVVPGLIGFADPAGHRLGLHVV